MLGVTVNDFTTVAQTNPKIVGLSNGNFVVAWQGTGSGDAAGVFATGIGVKAAPLVSG